MLMLIKRNFLLYFRNHSGVILSLWSHYSLCFISGFSKEQHERLLVRQ